MNVQNQRILKDIMDRTNGGTWELFTYSEKVTVIKIMQEYKQELDNFYRNEYYKVKMFAALNPEDILMDETEPDLSSFYKDNADYQFNKLMGI